jgi:mycothiol synthase
MHEGRHQGPQGPPVEVRRVGFRAGTDTELAAQLLVESEIEAERHPGSVAQPLESYRAFARSLPSQFHDHAWVAEEADGTPAACAACWTNAAGDPKVMEGYVYVRRSWRRRGIGWRLGQALVEEAVGEGLSTLVWSTSDAIPAGEAFSRQVGGGVGRVNRTSELALGGVDWVRVLAWTDPPHGRGSGYRLEFWDGRLPDRLLEDAARFHQLMNTQPRDDLAVGDVVLDTGQLAEIDRHLEETGRRRWTIFVRDPEGRCVGGTEMMFEPWEPETAHQQNTAIDPGHRGRGLAKWAKGAMLLRVRSERPEVTRIRTANAFSNDAMLAINTALGFATTEVRTEWQGKVTDLHEAFVRGDS